MRYQKVLLIGAVSLLSVLGLTAVASAQSFRSGDATSVSVSETVDGTLFMAGQSVDIAGTVNGDVYCAGQTVTISGTINGDVLCAGQTVRISGKVNGDVRAAGQTVSVDAEVERNVTMLGQTVTLEGAGSVGRDIVIGGQTALINGEVGRDIVVGSEKATVNSSVGRNIRGGMDQLVLGTSARIDGDVIYASQKTLERQNGSQVAGTVKREEPPKEASQKNDNPWPFLLWLYVAMITLAMALVLLMPRTFVLLSDLGLSRVGITVLTGFIASITVPVGLVIIAATVIGIPVALFGLLVWLVMVALAGPIAAFTLGRKLLAGRTGNILLYMLVGSAVALAVYIVPLVGWLIALLAFWFGIGAIIRQLFGMMHAEYKIAQKPALSPKKNA